VPQTHGTSTLIKTSAKSATQQACVNQIPSIFTEAFTSKLQNQAKSGLDTKLAQNTHIVTPLLSKIQKKTEPAATTHSQI